MSKDNKKSLKDRWIEIENHLKETSPSVKKSIEIFGLPAPGKKSSDSVDQFIGNLRTWYYGQDPYKNERRDLAKETLTFELGHVSGNPFRPGDLETINRFIKEQRNPIDGEKDV